MVSPCRGGTWLRSPHGSPRGRILRREGAVGPTRLPELSHPTPGGTPPWRPPFPRRAGARGARARRPLDGGLLVHGSDRVIERRARPLRPGTPGDDAALGTVAARRSESETRSTDPRVQGRCGED